MANEINVSLQVTARKGGADVEADPQYQVDMTGNNMAKKTQDIGTTAETIDLGDISGAPGFLVIENLDATNFVEIGGDSGLTVFKLKIRPGHAQLIEPSAVPLYAKADTAACRIQIAAAEV